MSDASTRQDPPVASAPLLVPPSLTRSTLLNLVGLGAPLVVALFAIPVLTRRLGTDRFGILTLMWVVLGYFSLFDLGLGRAITQIVSERMSRGRLSDVPDVVWTALGLMLGLGLITTLAAAALSSWLVHTALRVPAAFEGETLQAFYLLTLSIPIVMLTAGLRGLLEANHRFDLVNWIRAPLGVFTYLGPLLVLLFVDDLVAIVAVLIGGRLIALGVHVSMCLKVMPALAARPRFIPSLAPSLLKLGSWMSVSNLVGPILVNLDRFVIGSVISISVVAFYTVPFEVATKVLLLPAALAGVLFPAFAGTYATDRSRTASLFTQGIKVTWLVLFPVIVVLVAVAPEALSLWLGGEFGVRSTAVLQWLSVGVLINSIAQIPFALVQGAGRPDLTAKLHLVELPFYLAGMWWLITNYGIEGAAIAWTLRALVDALVLVAMVRYPLGVPLGALWPLAAITTFGLVSLGVVSLDLPAGQRVVIAAVSIMLFTLAGWAWLFSADDRHRIRARIAAIFPGN